jgi:hypothetical protein
LINIAHDWLLPVGAVSSLDDSASAFIRMPRDLFEYHPLANQMRALWRNVLRELGQEIERRQDLEIPLHSRSRSVTLSIAGHIGHLKLSRHDKQSEQYLKMGDL